MVRGVVRRYPPSWARLWPDPETGPWRVTLHWSLRDSVLVCVGYEVHAVDEGSAPDVLTVHKTIPLRQLCRESGAEGVVQARAELDELRRLIQSEPDEERGSLEKRARWVVDRANAHEGAGQPRRPGRPPISTEKLEQVAAVYVKALEAKTNPTEAVMKAFDRPKGTAADWVARAADKGLLPKTTRGRKRGDST